MFVIVFVHLFVHHNVNSICNVRIYLLIENLVLQRCEFGYMYCLKKSEDVRYIRVLNDITEIKFVLSAANKNCTHNLISETIYL